MVDTIISWVCAHPLQSVGLMVAVSIVGGVLLIPRIYELTSHGPPRC